MTEFQSLLVVLAAVYIACCLAWVPRTAFVFRARFTRRFACVPANSMLGGERGALAWLEPLPPFGLAFVAESLPFSLGEEGVLSWTSAAQPGGERPWSPPARFVAWDELESTKTRDRELHVNGSVFAYFGSEALARHAARLLLELARAKPSDRERRIEHEFERAHDRVAIADAAGRAERGTARLLAPSLALFALCFGFTPVVAVFGDVREQGPWLFLALIVLHSWAVVELWIAAGRVARSERWKHLLHGALSPIGIIRSRDGLLRDQLALYAPFAVAKVLCEERLEPLLLDALRDARHPWRPVCPLDDERARRVESSWRARIVRANTKLLARNGSTEDAAPERLGDDCVAYCARCESQYTKPDALCGKCGDRTLTPFESSSRTRIDGDLPSG